MEPSVREALKPKRLSPNGSRFGFPDQSSDLQALSMERPRRVGIQHPK